jgi:hypothetical protein
MEFVRIAQETGEHLYIADPWTSHSISTIQNRQEGFRTIVDQYPDLITVMEVGEDHMGADEATMRIVMDAFTAHPELNALFCDNGGGTGAINGLRALDLLIPYGEPGHVVTCFNDCDTVTTEAMDNGCLDAFSSHSFHDLNDVVVKMMFNHLILGKTVPKRIICPQILVTPETIDTAAGMEWGVPAAWPRLPAGQYDLWPIMNTTDYSQGLELLDENLNPIPGGISTPTVAERMELKGY